MIPSESESFELLNTLRASLCEPKIANKAWKELCSQVPFMKLGYRSIRLFPAVYKNLFDSKPQELGRLRGAYRSNWVRNQMAWFSYAPLIEDLSKEKIQYVIGKGFAVALFLGDLGIRQMGDLDIYLSRKDQVKAQRIFTMHGYSEKYSRSCVHGSFGNTNFDSGSYVNQKGYEIDVHLVDLGSDYLHRKLVSDGENFLALGKNTCRLPRPELTLIKSLRHGEKGISKSDYIQSVWDVARMLPFCAPNQLSKDIRRSGDSHLMNNMLDYLKINIGFPINSSRFRASRISPIRNLRNFQYQFFRRITRVRNPLPFLRNREAFLGNRHLWAIWKILGSIRPFERLIWRLRGGFLNDPILPVVAGKVFGMRSTSYINLFALKDAGEIRLRLRMELPKSQIEFFGVEKLTSNWHLFINGVLHGSIPIPGQDRYLFELDSSKLEISIQNQNLRCADCLNSALAMEFTVR